MSYEKITTLKAAYKAAGVDYTLRPVETGLPEDIARGALAFIDATVVTKALNKAARKGKDPFIPDYNNSSQDKYGPWAWGGSGDGSGSGFSFYVTYWTYTFTHSCGGARLALCEPGMVAHVKKHFPNLYKEIFLVLSGGPVYKV